MPNYVRDYTPGAAYFFTVVAFKRRPLFLEPLARQCLHLAFRAAMDAQYFEIMAICLLPDHMHSIWLLPENDANFSTRCARVKGMFSRKFLQQGGEDGIQTPSRLRKGETSLFQRRFWEHRITDELDMKRHYDYIHFNPVKHELVSHPEEWPWSTFHKYLRMGWYEEKTPVSNLLTEFEMHDFGE